MFEDGVRIGYGGLVHIAWDYCRAEISFLLDPAIVRREAEVAQIFGSWLELMKLLAFDDLNLARLTTETYAMREMFIRVLEAHGFVREGRLESMCVSMVNPWTP